jgi:hypothetical protein
MFMYKRPIAAVLASLLAAALVVVTNTLFAAGG